MPKHTVPNTDQDTIDEACRLAAERLGARQDAVHSHFVAGGDWDAATADELADLIVESWGATARATEAELAARHQ